jgi:hypothetical protein
MTTRKSQRNIWQSLSEEAKYQLLDQAAAYGHILIVEPVTRATAIEAHYKGAGGVMRPDHSPTTDNDNGKASQARR